MATYTQINTHRGILFVPHNVLKIKKVHTKSSSTLSPEMSENQETLNLHPPQAAKTGAGEPLPISEKAQELSSLP